MCVRAKRCCRVDANGISEVELARRVSVIMLQFSPLLNPFLFNIRIFVGFCFHAIYLVHKRLICGVF